ncbi:hypothetical protein GVAV_001455 [Gurleya vavrai]
MFRRYKIFFLNLKTPFTVSINEKDYTNVDFLIVEIVKVFPGAQIISFYNKTIHYKTILSFHNVNCDIQSIFENQINISKDVLIIDDYYTARKFLKEDLNGKTVFYIFRSNTFVKNDLYLSNFNIKCQSLESGISTVLDGTILIFDRNNEILNMKYKVKKREITYKN